jgi:hypothetical protein
MSTTNSESADQKRQNITFISQMMIWFQNKDDIPLEKLESTFFKQRGDRWDSTPELFRLLALRLK